MGVRVILVLDADELAERVRREARDVAGSEDVVAPPARPNSSTTMPSSTGSPAASASSVAGLDPEPGDDAVGLECRPPPSVTTPSLDPFDTTSPGSTSTPSPGSSP